MEIKGGRAEIWAGYKLAAAFGPPVAIMSVVQKGAPERTWTIRGKLRESNRFLLEHTQQDLFSIRFALGNDWCVLRSVLSITVRGEHVVVKASGEEEVIHGGKNQQATKPSGIRPSVHNEVRTVGRGHQRPRGGVDRTQGSPQLRR